MSEKVIHYFYGKHIEKASKKLIKHQILFQISMYEDFYLRKGKKTSKATMLISKPCDGSTKDIVINEVIHHNYTI